MINLPHEHLLIRERHVRVMGSTKFVRECEHFGICCELLYRDYSERNFVKHREMRPDDRAKAPTQQTVASTRCRGLVKPSEPRHQRRRALVPPERLRRPAARSKRTDDSTEWTRRRAAHATHRDRPNHRSCTLYQPTFHAIRECELLTQWCFANR